MGERDERGRRAPRVHLTYLVRLPVSMVVGQTSLWNDNRGLESVESLNAIRRSQYERVICSSASVTEGDRTGLLRAVIRFGRRDDGFRDHAETRAYGGLRLDRFIISPEAAIEAIRGLVNGTPSAEPWAQNRIQFNRAHTERPQGPNPPQPFPTRARDRWPSFNFYFLPQPNPVVGDRSGPLVARSLPPLLNPRNMVDEWLDTDARIMFGSTNYVEVVLPDFRARITKLELVEQGIRVLIDRPEGFDSPLAFQAAVTVGGVDKEVAPDPAPGGCLVPTTEAWSHFAFFILDANRWEIIDWAQLFPTFTYPAEYVSWTVAEKQLDQLIEEWETQNVEFKESAHAAADVIESVVAFSNSNEGSIIIGVTESGEVIGVGNPEKEEERLRNLISDWCDPPINPTFATLPYFDKKVLVVNVPKGGQGPYVSRYTGAIYLRRGGHDVPAKTRALIDSLYPATPTFR
jgi:Putative DNA-binding domain